MISLLGFNDALQSGSDSDSVETTMNFRAYCGIFFFHLAILFDGTKLSEKWYFSTYAEE